MLTHKYTHIHTHTQPSVEVDLIAVTSQNYKTGFLCQRVFSGGRHPTDSSLSFSPPSAPAPPPSPARSVSSIRNDSCAHSFPSPVTLLYMFIQTSSILQTGSSPRRHSLRPCLSTVTDNHAVKQSLRHCPPAITRCLQFLRTPCFCVQCFHKHTVHTNIQRKTDHCEVVGGLSNK